MARSKALTAVEKACCGPKGKPINRRPNWTMAVINQWLKWMVTIGCYPGAVAMTIVPLTCQAISPIV